MNTSQAPFNRYQKTEQMIKENSMMTDKEKQEWADLQKELVEKQAELEKLIEESEEMTKEASEAFEQIMRLHNQYQKIEQMIKGIQ
ncbi:MAG: hypothetical protein IJC73_01635 [Lentisphaeria bacterium]|nr:hypothetical protein [Lentisphaeria bacterium]